MSIPPLVCSTPPPPDQCEEDKDPGDFDISYNLSQDDEDDDDDGYNYGNFSSYNNFQSSIDIKKNNILCDNAEMTTKNIVQDSIETHTTEQKSNDEQHGDISEEYTNIEDLELDINVDSIYTDSKVANEVINGYNLDSSTSETDVVNEVTEDHLRTLSPSPITDENSIESTSMEDKKQKTSKDVLEAQELELDVSLNGPGTSSSSNSEVIQDLCMDTINKHKTTTLEAEFEDFDDFKFVGTEIKPAPLLDNCENPWENNESMNTEFGDFTANFEAVEELQSEPKTEIMQQDVQNNEIENEHYEVQNIKRISETGLSAEVLDDDDFGDFDDFKSSAVDDEIGLSGFKVIQEGPEMDFHLSDNEPQVMESITKVLSSVFTEDVTEPEIEFEGKLESMLSETWRHLRETDVRQPYIVNWNNSLGQKTLLRALCIDSRNILFGPKWGYSMPKYAVNLSNAPLQPQKPHTPATQSESTSEKSIKPGGWVDPFTSDGQESCNTETEGVVEVTPSDLDVFEAAISIKSEKIYSNTLKVQPLRQINLPDTHIFTPTDSETPRSKTIHYDSGPSILMPQPVLETNKSVKNIPIQNTETTIEKDDDDWEFQDFRGSASSAAFATASQSKELPLEENSEASPKLSVTYQTQVLQPIKMEPLMPSLNWPDPGEVKETFENFSDFISKSSWSNDASQITPPAETNVLGKINARLKSVEMEPAQPEATTTTSETFDDEFDTFQSALPPNKSMGDVAITCLGSNTLNIPHQGSNQSPSLIKEFDYTFPKTENNKSEIISVDNTTRANEALTQALGYNQTPIELTTNKNSLPLGNPISSNLLQPLPVTSNTSQKNQKAAQILQPLSLESYSQINWPNPGIDLQDLSRFNPVETLQSLKTELSASGSSKGASPVHAQKNNVNNQVPDDDIWGEFVSSKPKQQAIPKKAPVFVDDDEWTDFVSSPSPQNGLNTISLNVHTNSNMQKNSNSNKFNTKTSKAPLDIPTLNYITPKSSGHNSYNNRHFQNL